MQLQGGGGSQRGALVTDDNAADVRAQPRDAAPHLPVGLRYGRTAGTSIRLWLRPYTK